MRTFYRQLDAKSLVIGLLVSVCVLLFLDGQRSRAQTRVPRTISKYQMTAVGPDEVYVLDTETGLVSRPGILIGPPRLSPPAKYQLIAGDGGVYILNENSGVVRYRAKEECASNLNRGCLGPSSGIGVAVP